MRLLFTNNTLDNPAGTELSVFNYARALKKRGHEVTAFSRQQGKLAERLKASEVRLSKRSARGALQAAECQILGRGG